MKRPRSVNIGRLKNHLSRYLKQVRRGEEIIVRDRNVPIAKIVPLAVDHDLSAEELELIASGQMRPPLVRPTQQFWKRFWAMPAPRISTKRLVAAILADREED